jgi:hypothetical protein
MTTKHGAEAEALIESICRTMFLADFTVRSPPFKKGSGVEKEAADVLVPFGEVLIAFQVKSKKAPENAETAGDTYLRRVEKTVSKGIDQLKTIKRAINADHIEKLKNAAGIELPFDPKAVEKIIGVVVLDLPDQRNEPQDKQIAVYNDYEERYGIPAHVFRSDELEILTQEIDTLPDFLKYLEAREALFSKGKIGPFTSELNLLALYKTRPEQIKEAIAEPRALLVLEDGIWESYQNVHKEHIRQRDADNEPAFLIDRTIEWLHTSIGFSTPGNVPQVKALTPVDEVRNYATIALELSSTTVGHFKWTEECHSPLKP